MKKRNPVTLALIQQARNRVMRDRRRQAKQIRKVKHRGRDSGPFYFRSKSFDKIASDVQKVRASFVGR